MNHGLNLSAANSETSSGGEGFKGVVVALQYAGD